MILDLTELSWRYLFYGYLTAKAQGREGTQRYGLMKTINNFMNPWRSFAPFRLRGKASTMQILSVKK